MKIYIVTLKNIKTNALSVVEVFAPFKVGNIVGYGTDDGVEIAYHKVISCVEDQEDEMGN